MPAGRLDRQSDTNDAQRDSRIACHVQKRHSNVQVDAVCPTANSHAEIVLMTTPAAATHMIVLPTTTSGERSAPTASQSNATDHDQQNMAFASAVKMEDRAKLHKLALKRTCRFESLPMR